MDAGFVDKGAVSTAKIGDEDMILIATQTAMLSADIRRGESDVASLVAADDDIAGRECDPSSGTFAASQDQLWHIVT